MTNPATRQRSVEKGERQCSTCKGVFPLDEFAPDRTKASGFRSCCRGCDRRASKRYYASTARRSSPAWKRSAAPPVSSREG